MNEVLKKPIKYFDKDYCLECNTEHGIEIFDYFNHPIGYTSLLRTVYSGAKYPRLNKSGIFSMRCNRCGHAYDIKWEEDIPIPVSDNGRTRRWFLEDYGNKNNTR